MSSKNARKAENEETGGPIRDVEADAPLGEAVEYPSSAGKQLMACGCGATRFMLVEHAKVTAQGDLVDPELSFVCEGCGEERGFDDLRPVPDWQQTHGVMEANV